MMTLRQKAVALSVVVLMNVGVLLLAWWFLLLSVPISVAFAVAVLRQ